MRISGRWLGSLQCTTLCLGWLALLVFWGSLYQIRVGLYEAELRFFDAWLIWVGHVIPLPATRLIMALLAVNLLFSRGIRLPRAGNQVGLWLLHLGFFLLIAGGLGSSIARQDGRLWLRPGDRVHSAVMSDGSLWELPMRLTLIQANELRDSAARRMKDFRIRLLVDVDGLEREGVVSLNHPLRVQGFAIYQMSFAQDSHGDVVVGFLVSRNPARWLPYAFSLLSGVGLMFHFGGRLLRSMRREGLDA